MSLLKGKTSERVSEKEISKPFEQAGLVGLHHSDRELAVRDGRDGIGSYDTCCYELQIGQREAAEKR